MRKTYSSEFKAKLVLEVLRGERLLNEIASHNNVHPNMLTRWKSDATSNFHLLFENENAKMRRQSKEYEAQIEELYKQIGRLTAQYEWMKKNLESRFHRSERISTVDWDHPVFPVSVQAQMLSLNRSSLYYRSRPISE
ncbi:transposase [Enterocloster clostridioformis]|uniref:transposase n=2 Tax=Enterocloster clostridioformis TaxID=1531 RepID=UPI0026750591|nr:transposase [Enterocloster clostridioformis]